MRRPRTLALGLALALLGAAPLHSAAQQPGHMQQMQQQQMVRMQEQVHQLNQLMGRMSGLQERAQIMERQMERAVQRLRLDREEMTGPHALQLRTQERLRSMAQAMSEGAQEMQRAMEQLRNMVGDPEAMWNREMERDMERLREHWQEMSGQLEEGLRIMERLRDRIHQPEQTGER